jgi:hypothetical protein
VCDYNKLIEIYCRSRFHQRLSRISQKWFLKKPTKELQSEFQLKILNYFTPKRTTKDIQHKKGTINNKGNENRAWDVQRGRKVNVKAKIINNYNLCEGKKDISDF